jgi:hypothetical protein
VTEAAPAVLQRLLAGELERRGWEWNVVEGRRLVEQIVANGRVDAQQLAQGISSTYLERVGAARADMAEAIEHAVGGCVPRPEEHVSTTLIAHDNRYQLNIAAGAQVTSSNVNVGGAQINIKSNAERAEILAGVGALVRAGLIGDWNIGAARELGSVIDAREDIALADIEGTVAEVVEADPPEPGRARSMIESISAQGLGGALATGITTVIGALVRNPPL